VGGRGLFGCGRRRQGFLLALLHLRSHALELLPQPLLGLRQQRALFFVHMVGDALHEGLHPFFPCRVVSAVTDVADELLQLAMLSKSLLDQPGALQAEFGPDGGIENPFFDGGVNFELPANLLG
jgi:hypothetical protein